MKWVLGAIAALTVTLVGASALAHLELRSPSPRYGPGEQKAGPCGRAGGTRSDTFTTYEPGERIEVVWEETVNHPAHYRIMFDADGQDDFFDPLCLSHCETRSDPEMPTFEMGGDPMILVDGIEDGDFGIHRATVTLPDIECDNCTLQVIQVMYDKRPYESPGNDVYYTCADLVLERSAPADAGTADAGSRDAGWRDAGVTDAGSPPGTADSGTASEPVTGGCAAGGPVQWAPAALAALVPLLAVRRRR